MNARKLRVVPDCPQPDPPAYRPVQYGAPRCPLKPKGTPITANPAPGELHAIMFSQSARTKAGVRADPISYADSVAHLRNAERVRRHNVTVPQPLCQPAPDKRTTPPPGEPVRAGSQHRPALTLPNEGTTENNAGRFLSRGIKP